MIVFTKVGDTPESIANDCLGYNDAHLADQIKEANITSFAWQLFNGCGVYSDNRAIWLPIKDDSLEPVDKTERESIIHTLDFMTTTERETLAKAQRSGIDIHQAILSHETNSRINALIGSLTGVAAEVTTSIGHIGEDLFSDFEKKIEQASDLLIKRANASSLHTKVMLKKDYERLMKEINERYPRYLRYLTERSRYYFKKPQSLLHQLKNNPWVIDSYIDATKVLNMAKFLRFIKVGGIFGLAICGGFDAYDTWEQTHSWEAVSKKILEAIVDAGVGIVFGILVAGFIIGAEITAPIWLTILAGAAISTGLSYGFDKLIANPLIEKA